MEDRDIIALFNSRDENAINEIDKKYRNFCQTISFNILADNEDVEECINDTYYSVWNNIPPDNPTIFSVYIAKITRYISLKKLRFKKTVKRGGENIFVAFDELSECIADKKLIETEIESKELAEIINSFLGNISVVEQKVFISRYWYFESIKSISRRFGFSESKVKSLLHRLRKKLKLVLKEKGVSFEN